MEKTFSKYAVKFDSSSRVWYDDNDYNVLRILSLADRFSDLLETRGYVFLRDILEALDLPITKDSITVGWYYDTSNKLVGNYVEITIHDLGDETYMLDFNVDGDISSKF